ncbi:MAG TPA: hypothetical protein VFH59_08445 [Frateuria sp.]|uniref:hypothetical protein n=1 Tax=Frateuria sp. TaxID=2211372 RepID=UPI002D807E6B|nr:hypothetical protein [Frateuria sp.]HET6805452.1 hypothetical protein [Frateuria sp.]
MSQNKQPPRDTDARRELDRDRTGQAKTARGDEVETELDQETHRLQRRYDSDAPRNRD